VAIVVDGGRVASEDEVPAMVRVWRDGQAIAVRSGMRLEEGDRISTGRARRGRDPLPERQRALPGRASRGRIGSFTEALGEMFAKVWGVFSIETEYVKAGARGTAFGVRAAPDGRTEILVLNGSVEVTSRATAWRPLLLHAGSATVAHPPGAAATAGQPGPSWRRRRTRSTACSGWCRRRPRAPAGPPRPRSRSGRQRRSCSGRATTSPPPETARPNGGRALSRRWLRRRASGRAAPTRSACSCWTAASRRRSPGSR
jgi:hypothetical protein